jgi:predicted MFS family arabinose efflux permease
MFFRLFLAAYFCAGVGYVVSVTFIVAIINGLPGMSGKGGLAFLVMGIAAAPAAFIWDRVARRIGYFASLSAASVLQIIGILLPVLVPSLPFALLGCVLFGATFVALVSLVLTMSGHYFPTRPAKMMGKMTAAYGVAQIMGPAVTGVIAEYTGNYNLGLYLASFVMVIGLFLFIFLKFLEKKESSQIDTIAAYSQS